MSHPSLRGKVVVVTGASSGIGRAAAVELARRGARVVLAARRAEALEETAALCESVGPRGVAVVTDVTLEADVDALAQRARQVSGVIDAWVNNAGVTSFGLLETTPLEDARRVLETNLWGSIFGARAVLPIFRYQGFGVLINVGSILSKVGQPFVPAYVISKFALRGLSEALRAELADKPNIHVCTLLPYAVDTPHFQTAPNLIGKKPYAMPPVQQPEVVAAALADLVLEPRRERHVPRTALVGLALHSLFPNVVERVIHDSLARWHFGAPQAVDAAGNLWQPSKEPAAIHGTRRPRLNLAQLIAWVFARYAQRALRALPPH